MFNNLPLPELQSIRLPIHRDSFVETSMLRLDNVCPVMSGNKLYKLLPNIGEARRLGCDTLLSFGGAFSNHLAALANAGRDYGFKTVAVVRGESTAKANSTLARAIEKGMVCHFVDRKTYQRRYDEDYLAHWQRQYPSAYIIPEGGSNALAEQGCADLGQSVRKHYPHIKHFIIAVGTGTTAQGLSAGLANDCLVYGVPVLKMAFELSGVVLVEAFHHGGYAKISQDLMHFMNAFETHNSLLLDPVYSAKMAYAAGHIIEHYQLDPQQVALVHTGGLQGRDGMMQAMMSSGYVNGACT